jgi:hypothetical protein
VIRLGLFGGYWAHWATAMDRKVQIWVNKLLLAKGNMWIYQFLTNAELIKAEEILYLYTTMSCIASNPWLRTLGTEIMAMRYGNLFTLLPLPCSALPRSENLLVVTTLFRSSEVFRCLQFGLGLVAKFYLGVYSCKAKRVRAGSECYTCVLLIHMWLRDWDIFLVVDKASTQ